ncbi:hypothetical protein RMCBS344292_17130 [Rhizopus microsporus]|nr:hypothetical protein RMCBS344292_17130 [Rhizopus microsporus]
MFNDLVPSISLLLLSCACTTVEESISLADNEFFVTRASYSKTLLKVTIKSPFLFSFFFFFFFLTQSRQFSIINNLCRCFLNDDTRVVIVIIEEQE